MRLEKLYIRHVDYGKDKGKFTGEAEFTGERGTVEVNLSPDHCDRIFQVLADSLIEVAKECARDLTLSVIEHQSATKALT